MLQAIDGYPGIVSGPYRLSNLYASYLLQLAMNDPSLFYDPYFQALWQTYGFGPDFENRAVPLFPESPIEPGLLMVLFGMDGSRISPAASAFSGHGGSSSSGNPYLAELAHQIIESGKTPSQLAARAGSGNAAQRGDEAASALRRAIDNPTPQNIASAVSAAAAAAEAASKAAGESEAARDAAVAKAVASTAGAIAQAVDRTSHGNLDRAAASVARTAAEVLRERGERGAAATADRVAGVISAGASIADLIDHPDAAAAARAAINTTSAALQFTDYSQQAGPYLTAATAALQIGLAVANARNEREAAGAAVSIAGQATGNPAIAVAALAAGIAISGRTSGQQVGSAVGAIVGSYFGPVGSVVGSFLGGMIGGMFDGDPLKKEAKRSAVIYLERGNLRTNLDFRKGEFDPVNGRVRAVAANPDKYLPDEIRGDALAFYRQDEFERGKFTLVYDDKGYLVKDGRVYEMDRNKKEGQGRSVGTYDAKTGKIDIDGKVHGHVERVAEINKDRQNGEIVGVLDIDSDKRDKVSLRFNEGHKGREGVTIYNEDKVNNTVHLQVNRDPGGWRGGGENGQSVEPSISVSITRYGTVGIDKQGHARSSDGRLITTEDGKAVSLDKDGTARDTGGKVIDEKTELRLTGPKDKSANVAEAAGREKIPTVDPKTGEVKRDADENKTPPSQPQPVERDGH